MNQKQKTKNVSRHSQKPSHHTQQSNRHSQQSTRHSQQSTCHSQQSNRHSREGGNLNNLITDNLDTWTTAIKSKSRTGRGSNKTYELYGIKKLRELILDLAVRGLLVPQDPNDEPASELLKKINIEKEALLKNKEIKKPKTLLPVSENEKFINIPDNWEFARLNDLGEWGAGATPSRRNPEFFGGNIPWFKSGELNEDYISESEELVTKLALKKSSLRYNKSGDVLFAMYGATIGKTSILNIRATTNQAVCACTPFYGFVNTFLLTLLKAYKSRFIGMGAGGAQPNISREKIIATVIALPPTKEQKRIVAKVDELMALCDQLEQQTDFSINAHKLLVENLLNALTQAKDHKTFQQAWQHIAKHFDTLFTTEHSIDQLKQTILQLAVMGKLVPQNPNDEPASELLKKIATEKEKLIKEGKIKKQKPLPEITEEEKPFELPFGWEWSRLGVSTNYGLTDKIESRDVDEHTWVLELQDVEKETSKLLKKVIYKNRKFKSSKNKFYTGDVIYGKLRPYLDKVIVANEIGVCTTEMIPIRSFGILIPEYLRLSLKSPYFKVYANDSIHGMNLPRLGTDKARRALISIPPKPEQIKIINKVDKLMILCDQMKSHITNSKKIQTKITNTLTQL